MRKLWLAIAVSIVAAGSSLAAPFTPGNVVVSRVGDGTAALGNTATAVFLDEYTTSGALVQTVALPTIVDGGNNILTGSGSATSDLGLTLSADGRFLAIGGYNAALGTAGVASSNLGRTIGLINVATGAVNTSTTLTDAAILGNNFRTVYTTNGTDIWAAGAAGGVRYTTTGSTTSTQLSTTVTNIRRLNAFGGQLYTSTMSGAFRGVNTVGTGLPTTSGQTISLLSGFDPSATSVESAYDFYLVNPTTLYVTDDRTSGQGGIQKWTLSGGTWSLAYSGLAGTGNIGFRGLTSGVGGALFGVGTDSHVYSITDTGSALSFTSIVTGATNTAIRGIATIPSAVPVVVPEAGSLTLASLGVLPLVGAIAQRRRRTARKAA